MARILIVEDDVRTGDLLRNHLRAAGHECVVVENGERAIEVAHLGGLDMMILDVMLPGGASGFEVCRRLRGNTETLTLPVLMLTAMSGEEEVMHGLAQGADDYVTKPFEVQGLIQRVDRLLRSNVAVNVLDEVTALPGASAVKREVQKRVSRQEIFTLSCAELIRLREFSYKCGTEARQKAIRHLARALSLCGKELGDENFIVGHMGGGYFACLTSMENAGKYCERIVSVWQSHLPSFYEGIGFGDAYQETLASPALKKVPMLGLLMCVTSYTRKESVTSQELFEILMRIRNKALASSAEGVHYDRRA